MKRFFVRLSPTLISQTKFFAVWASDCQVAAGVAARRSGFVADDFAEDDCLLVSEQCVPVAHETPSDLRFIPAGCVFPAVTEKPDRGRIRLYRKAA